MLIISIVLILVLTLLILEVRTLKGSVHAIKTRIHINGTRGKSSITEYLTEALNTSGNISIGKITGIKPTVIKNGERHLINRAGSPRIQEQFSIIKAAAKNKCDSLVLECMSINPELQKIESKFFKPHIYVITNIRDDHREEMGLSIHSQIEAICGAIPSNSTVITGSKEHFELIFKAAKLKGSKAIAVNYKLVDETHDLEPNNIFQENLALALTVCQELNLDIDKAFKKIVTLEKNRPSKLFSIGDRDEIYVLNGFDVNDTDSATIFLDQWMGIIGDYRKVTVVFNTRADRPLRTDLFTKWISELVGLEKVIITGSQAQRAKLALKNKGLKSEQLLKLKTRDIGNIKTLLRDVSDKKVLILLIGNIAGDGFKILDALQ